MIQGNYRDAWVKINFPRLLNLLNIIENSACDNETTTFAVHFGTKRESPVNKLNIHSLDRIGNHLSESHIHLTILNNFRHSIKFLSIQREIRAFNKRKQTFMCTRIFISLV